MIKRKGKIDPHVSAHASTNKVTWRLSCPKLKLGQVILTVATKALCGQKLRLPHAFRAPEVFRLRDETWCRGLGIHHLKPRKSHC